MILIFSIGKNFTQCVTALPQKLSGCQGKKSLVSACWVPRNASSFQTWLSMYPESNCRDGGSHPFKVTNGTDRCLISVWIGRTEWIEDSCPFGVQSNQNQPKRFVSMWTGKFREHAICPACLLIKNNQSTLWFFSVVALLFEAFGSTNKFVLTQTPDGRISLRS